MVRTRSSSSVKAGGKAPRKSTQQSASTSTADSTSTTNKKSGSSGGNTVQVQPTPAWQNKITQFMGEPPVKRAKVETLTSAPSKDELKEGTIDTTEMTTIAGKDSPKLASNGEPKINAVKSLATLTKVELEKNKSNGAGKNGVPRESDDDDDSSINATTIADEDSLKLASNGEPKINAVKTLATLTKVELETNKSNGAGKNGDPKESDDDKKRDVTLLEDSESVIKETDTIEDGNIGQEEVTKEEKTED